MKPITATILIGNSDDKLSQRQWSDFVADIHKIVEFFSTDIHFFGAPPSFVQWQNAAIVFETNDEKEIILLKRSLVSIKKKYNQDSIALVVGQTEYI